MSRYISKKDQEIAKQQEEVAKELSKLKNTLQQKAFELQGDTTTKDSNLFLFGPPVSPKEFILSKDYYGSNNEIYPWIIDDMEEIFSGPHHAPKYHTVVEFAGTGSGKAILGGFIISYMWYWLLSFKSLRDYFASLNCSWMEDSIVAFCNMAPTAKQAKDIVFDKVTKTLNRIKVLRERNWLPDPNINSELIYKEYNEEHKKQYAKLSILPGNSSKAFTLGHSIIGGIIDEACFWETKLRDPVEDLYKTLNDRRKSRFKNNGVIVLISSAWTEGNFMEKLALDAETDPGIFYKRRSRYECKPEFFASKKFEVKTLREKADGQTEEIILHPPEELREDYEKDKNKALRDIDAIPSVAGQPFYPDFMLLLSRVNKDRTDPAPDLGKAHPESAFDIQTRLPDTYRGIEGVKYRIHADLAKGCVIDGQCGVGFAMVHTEPHEKLGFKVCLDLAVRFKAPVDKEVDIIEILDFIKWLHTQRNFKIEMVTFDQYNSLTPKQIINKWGLGITASELGVDYTAHTYLKNLIKNGQFDFYYDQNLLYELKRLEDHLKSIEPGLNSYKDESDAVAGAAYSTANKEVDSIKVIPPRTSRIIGLNTGGVSGIVKGVVLRPPGQYRDDSNSLPKYRQ